MPTKWLNLIAILSFTEKSHRTFDSLQKFLHRGGGLFLSLSEKKTQNY